MQKTDQIKKKSEIAVSENTCDKKASVNCPVCNQLTYLIWVHGHYQCLNCKNVIYSCCEIYAE